MTFLLFLLAAPAPQTDNLETRNTQVARQLIEILRNDSGRASLAARIQAANTLAEMGFDARAIIPEIISLLNNSGRRYPEPLEEAFVRAIGRIGAPARVAIPALVKTAGVDRDVDRTIAESVRQILRAPDGPGEIPALIRQLKSPDASERLIAAKKLSALGPPARIAAPALTEALADSDVDVRRQAFQALQIILPGVRPSEAAVAALVKDLQDSDEGIRLRAAKALGRIGPAAISSVTALQAIARNDPDLDVRRVAAEALFRIQQR